MLFALYVDGKKQGMSEKTATSGAVTATLSMEPYSDHEVSLRILTSPADTLAHTVQLDWAPEAGYTKARLQADAEALRRFSLDDTALGERVSSEYVSPDGKWLLTSFTNMYEPDKTLQRATLTELKTCLLYTSPSPRD